MTQAWSVAAMLASTFVSATAAIFMKLSSKKFALTAKGIFGNVHLYIAAALYMVSAIVGVIAFKGGELTVLVPIASLNYVWASIIAVNFLDEKMNRNKWLGILFIVLGVIIVGLGDII